MIAPASASAAPSARPRDRSRPDTRRRYHEHFLSTPAYPCDTSSGGRRGVQSGQMATKVDRERLRSLVEPHWRRLYNYVFRLTLDRERAERYLMDIYEQAAEQAEQAPAGEPELARWLAAPPKRRAGG